MTDLPLVDIRALLVPLPLVFSVGVGEVYPSEVSGLEADGFDQAPVHARGQWVGIVPTLRLRELVDSGEVLSPDDPAVSAHSIYTDRVVDVADVLEALETERAALVVDSTTGDHVGMVTISDLNRHAVRKALYDLLSEVESRLATLVVHTLDDEVEVLRHLGELEQVHLLGHYHYMKQGGVELSLLAGATLSQLLKITKGEGAVLDRLGYESEAFSKLSGTLPELRNRVMHPVRPLIHKQEDVSRVLRRVRRLAELRTRLRSAFDSIPRLPLF